MHRLKTQRRHHCCSHHQAHHRALSFLTIPHRRPPRAVIPTYQWAVPSELAQPGKSAGSTRASDAGVVRRGMRVCVAEVMAVCADQAAEMSTVAPAVHAHARVPPSYHPYARTHLENRILRCLSHRHRHRQPDPGAFAAPRRPRGESRCACRPRWVALRAATCLAPVSRHERPQRVRVAPIHCGRTLRVTPSHNSGSPMGSLSSRPPAMYVPTRRSTAACRSQCACLRPRNRAHLLLALPRRRAPRARCPGGSVADPLRRQLLCATPCALSTFGATIPPRMKKASHAVRCIDLTCVIFCWPVPSQLSARHC